MSAVSKEGKKKVPTSLPEAELAFFEAVEKREAAALSARLSALSMDPGQP